MARKRKKQLRLSPIRSLCVLLILASLFVLMIRFHDFIKHEIASVRETPKSETKRIPREVRKNLKQNYNPNYKVPILVYHYVEYVQDKRDTIRQSLDIEPNTFDAQVKTLREAGYTFMTAGELADVIDGKKTLPKKPVVLTFDDGHWDVDTVVLPILKKYHAKATAYLITGFIGGSDFLSDAQVKDLINSGLVEIGAHTVHHVYLKGKLLPVVDYEVNQSKKDLEQKYRIKVNSFAYPDGAFDQQAINAVSSAGFTNAVTTVPGIIQSGQNKYFLFRLRPGYRTGQELINYFNQTTFKPY